jgi:uncharacterized membrane protein YidH (DUF202 family)
MVPDDPEDLDPGLARERTRLSWVRTAIAFAAVGAAMLRKEVIAGGIVLAMAPLIWVLGRLALRPSARADLLARRLLLVTVVVVAVAVVAAVLALVVRAPASLGQLLSRYG